ncbi:flavin reductase family protein [Persicobacter psychrovividus]|uniref:Flavin oxidoreductase n=1 Tax=Persicobacter psychrovividus TaxID=387638 RepID=A0ABM7VIV7_9BACT|nr:flavin oxidoreductase [Persicobacter psychrovividus]
MKLLQQEAINQLPKRERIKLINAITGIKPANLIGTVDAEGQENLAIISSVVHLGSSPPLIGYISRPQTVERHTFANIQSQGYYSINHIPEKLTEQAHQTSGKYAQGVSEFEACGISPEYLGDFPAPFVAKSPLKIGMKLREILPIPINGTVMIIGEVQQVAYQQEAMQQDGELNLSTLQTVGISGLNSYYRLEKLAQYPQVKLDEAPQNNS